MIKRDEINEISALEVGKFLQSDLDLIKVNIKELMDETEVRAKEQELMDVMKDYDEYLRKVLYDLPDSIFYDNVLYSKKDICDKIVTFLNKNEVEFQYTEGLYQLSKIWRAADKLSKLDYFKYDSTLRILGQLRYKGFKEWKDILSINAFFSSAHEQYTRDTAYNIYLAQIHNAIIDKLQEIVNSEDENIPQEVYNPEETVSVEEVVPEAKTKSKRQKS